MKEDSSPGTFRDPAGSLKLEGEFAVRTIRPHARQAALDFLASPFCARLQLHGDIVGTSVENAEQPGTDLRLLHPRIAVPSYPWEWTPSQWLAAAELTLRLCEEAIDAGWILKDATPLNILFVGTRPVLVDVLSFEPRDAKTSIWLAYAQYVRTFLLPLLMNKLLHWPLALSLFRRDGYEPAELFAAMSWRQRLSPAAFWPVTLPAWFERRSQGPAPAPPARTMEAEAATHVLKRTLAGLRKRTQQALPKSAKSEWSEYQSSLTHYTDEQSAAKAAWVRKVLETTQPKRVLDVGANTGEFSAMAANAGAEVVALERDEAAADRLYRMARAQSVNILTLHSDLARPTPSAGWENSEQTSLLSRLEEKFDLVMMLAVIHHLILMEQIPLRRIIELCARLTTRYLIIEWVPPTDPMYISLMRGRYELYGGLSEDDLHAACEGIFNVVEREDLSNGRILFLFERAA